MLRLEGSAHLGKAPPFTVDEPARESARTRVRHRRERSKEISYKFQSTGPQPSSPSSAFAREKTLLPVNGVAVFVLLRGLG